MKRALLTLSLLIIIGTLTACGRNSSSEDAFSIPTITNALSETPRVNDTQTPATDAALHISPTITLTPFVSSTPSPSPKPTSIPMPLFGVETHKPSESAVLDMLTDSGSRLIRYGSVLWDVVEAQENIYNWAAIKHIDNDLAALSSKGFEIILIVRGTPLWAQKVYGVSCGPVSPEKLDAFAEFLTELVIRYSIPPYNVHYWEIGNEPDVDPSLVPPNSGFGCWGDKNDPYYGGGYYAEMLKTVYPAIKAVDPQAQVLNGGLLLDCDPAHPPEGKDCQSAKFFEGILRNGGGNYLDVVNFHGYPPYIGSLKWDNEYPSWKARGGVVVGKIDFLQEVMAQYGLDKPLFQTEISLLCPEWSKTACLPPGEDFYQAQADFVVRSFVRNWVMGIKGTIWYDFEGKGWRYSGLVGNNYQNPKPAFLAFRYLNQKLAGMAYIGEANLAPGVQAHRFASEGKETWVAWSLDETPQPVILPVGVIAVFDEFGNEIGSGNNTMEILSPVYLDVSP